MKTKRKVWNQKEVVENTLTHEGQALEPFSPTPLKDATDPVTPIKRNIDVFFGKLVNVCSIHYFYQYMQ